MYSFDAEISTLATVGGGECSHNRSTFAHYDGIKK